MEIVDTLIFAFGIIFLYVTFWFVVSLIFKRNDVADIAWGLGIAFVALIGFFVQSEMTDRMQLLLILAFVWGLRLSGRIFLRNIKKSEDARYKAWRESWGRWFVLRSYAQVYLLQGALMVVVGYAFLHTSVYDTTSLNILDVVGVVVWLVGFVFEVVGDYQLDRFIKNPKNKGKIMMSGLWTYTRHPNYFGEVTQWWGIWLIALSVPYGVFAIVSPLMISFLILKVSGIPMLEERFAGNPEFEEYKRRTNAFFPGPRRV